ncbi:unnamed protein product [Alopecurus aequalis]
MEAGGLTPAVDSSKFTCYNCGKVGHRQADYTEDPFCIKCNSKGHPSAMCCASDERFDPYWAGYGHDGIGFMCLEVEDDEATQAPPNSATVFIEGAKLSAAEVEGEFKELVDEHWDWQVRQLSEVDFALVFPSAGNLLMASCGGGLRLPISKAKATVIEGAMDDQASEVLMETWVKLHGVPPPYRHTGRLRVGARLVGRPMLVDEAAFEDPKQPIQMQFGCRAGRKIPEFFVLCVNGQGYNVRVEVEKGKEQGGPSLPPPLPPPREGDEDDDSDKSSADDEDKWDGK